VQGHSWDVDNKGLWVDKGCRAEFRVIDRYNNSSSGDYEATSYHDEEQYRNERYEQELRALEHQQDQLHDERARLGEQTATDADITCPLGMEPGRCTEQQREEGCKDMRTAGGLGCMSPM
jgi:hypothetical protein